MPGAVPTAAAPPPADCFVPVAAAAERVLDSQRAARYAALLQMIDEIQRRRAIAEVAQVVAARWKHCANVAHWRLLIVHRGRAALIVSHGRAAEVTELALDELGAWDLAQWRRMLPSYDNGERLAALRAGLPGAWSQVQAAELAVLPVQQADEPIALLSALSGGALVFDMLDRKFLGHVAGAMAGRIHALMTEQALAGELVAAEQQIAEQRHAAVLGRLVNGVAHELNTPLGVQISACDSLSEMLKADPPAPAEGLLDAVDLIGVQARRAARIVRRLKQVSAMSQSGSRSPTPLLEAIESIAVAFASRPDAPQIALSGDDTISVDVDREALGVLLGELMDNAAVHGRRADGPCELSLELQRADGLVWLDVRDDGPGMDPATAARFFEPFVTTRQSQGHMGLGGYIARSLARDALQGDIQLRGAAAGEVWIRLGFSPPPSSAP